MGTIEDVWDEDGGFPATADEPSDSTAAASEEPDLYYKTLDEFVEKFLVKTYRRSIEGRRANGETEFRWDARWWEHPEAVLRLGALWRAWEHLRQDPALGMSVWLRDHADHHMPILLSGFGPFRRSGCANDEEDDQLPYERPPSGLYDH